MHDLHDVLGASRDLLSPLHESLLNWFAINGRSFPWRHTQIPFHILLAEKLLQQTAAREIVVKVYLQLVEQFPDVAQLASADHRRVLQLVSPLGLPQRAHELILCSQTIISHHNGVVPSDLEFLKLLPGVGEYIARAVLCFAYRKPIAVVDTNVGRWLFRLFLVRDQFPHNPARNRNLLELAQTLIDSNNPREYNWAVLDLCSLVCRPRNPDCVNCPLIRICMFGQRIYSRGEAEWN